MNNCPKCKGTDIKTHPASVGGRELCFCRTCEHTWERERISVKIASDGTPLIELEVENPFDSILKKNLSFFQPNGVFPFNFKMFFVDFDDDSKEE